MYRRTFSGMFVVSSQLRCKYKSATKILPKSSSTLSFVQSVGKQNTSSIYSCTSLRSCSTIEKPPNKDDEAQKKLNEYLKDPENERHFKILQLEVDVMRQNGENVPNVVRPRDWYELVQLESRNKRRRQLDFLFSIERKKENKVTKQRVKREEYEADDNPSPESHLPDYLQHKLGGNTPFLRFYDTTVNHFYNWRVARASMWGQPIVIDCGYENNMTRQEIKLCSKQLQLTFAANRAHDDPYDLHYCNLDQNGFLHSSFHSYIPTMYEPEFPINLSPKSYLDHFKKEKIVYLTPDAPQEMITYDNDAVYVIGAIVDKVSGKPLSMAKAKREGLKMARLPIDRYLNFGSGSGKSLTLNQMISILLDMRQTGDWKYSLRHVPNRKLMENRMRSMENKVDKYLTRSKEQAEVYTPPRDLTQAARKKISN